MDAWSEADPHIFLVKDCIVVFEEVQANEPEIDVLIVHNLYHTLST